MSDNAPPPVKYQVTITTNNYATAARLLNIEDSNIISATLFEAINPKLPNYMVPHATYQQPRPCLHFVGFVDDRYWNAVKVWGLPDIVHRVWDHRAKAEIAPDDVVVFAQYSPDDPPTPFSWNDSERF